MQENHPTATVMTGSPVSIEYELEGFDELGDAQTGIVFKDQYGNRVATFNTGMRPPEHYEAANRQLVTLKTSRFPFTPGEYAIDIGIGQRSSGRLDYVPDAFRLSVVCGDVYSTGYELKAQDGVVFFDGEWSINRGSTEEICENTREYV
jgi:hypothetical protein